MCHKTRAILLTCVACAIGPLSVIAMAEPRAPDRVIDLFTRATDQPNSGAAADPWVIRSRTFFPRFDLLSAQGVRSGRSLRFNLFDDTTVVGVVTRVQELSADGLAFFGRLDLDGVDTGTFTLVVRKGVMIASIRAQDEGVYAVRYVGAGVHAVQQIDEDEFPPCGMGHEQTLSPQPARADMVSSGEDCVEDGSVIDVMVFYTPLARENAGGAAAMEAIAEFAVGLSNTSYENSLIDTRLRLVYIAETDYDEAPYSFSDHLSHLRTPGDGHMDEVHALRDEYRGDLIALLVDDMAWCGVAYLMRELSTDFGELGFSVSNWSCAGSNHTFAHELGHNMGCHHDRANASGPGLFEYSYGYQDPGFVFRTVMAYPCVTSCPRILHFSNPDVSYDGLPTGVAVGEPDSAHCALTINTSAPVVACFRNADCNDNGVVDVEDIANGTSEDCTGNGIPDECEADCNGNGAADSCDILDGTSEDCTGNGIPDECEADCNGNGGADSCDIESGASRDCNLNGIPDECDIAEGASDDCNLNDVPDDCETDCDGNGVVDACDIRDGTFQDADGNRVPDVCEVPVLFVDAHATGFDYGTSWADAFVDLQDALRVAGSPAILATEIWVARGVYAPSKPTEPNDPRTATFQMVSGIALYGGYASGEVDRDQRDPTANLTILSGDLAGDDGPDFAGNDENAYHVVTASFTESTAVLDGFTITAGNADGGDWDEYGAGMHNLGGDATVANCVFRDNWGARNGGGVHSSGVNTPTFINCRFVGNRARKGAGMYIGNVCMPTVVNCVFNGNGAIDLGAGAAAWCGGSLPNFVNSTFVNNYILAAGGVGAGVVGWDGARIRLTNCILWGNYSVGGTNPDDYDQLQIAVVDTVTTDVNYSCVQDSLDVIGGTGNVDYDPLFADLDGPDNILGNADDDLRLSPGSPLIDAGDNAAVCAAIDHDGNPRFLDDPDTPDTGNGTSPLIDMGAHEFVPPDCNGNGAPDSEEILLDPLLDGNDNGIPDECETDCNNNGVRDYCDIADQTSDDCNTNDIPDECDLSSGAGRDCNANESPDECDISSGASTDADGDGMPDECPAPKNRYISFPRVSSADVMAYRVTLTASAEFPDAVGQMWWLDAPDDNSICRLVGSAVFRNWSGAPTLLYAGDCEIAPATTYEIQSTTDGAAFSGPIVAATINKPGAQHYGDVVGIGTGLLPPQPGFTPPNGAVNVSDIQAYILTFQGVSSPSAHTTWIDLHGEGVGCPPNFIINVSDLQRIKFGFLGQTYAETPGQENPGDCP